MIMKVALPIVLALCAQVAWAQNATDISNGLGFANSIAPTSPSQVINPGSVNSTAWGNQASTPTTVPTGLGGFSSPNTDSSMYSSAQTSSLSALGDQAMINCASYTPGSDPYQNQYCSAVNFLNNQCMQPTTGETSVLGGTGTAQGSASNCAGTYGAGQSQFGYSNQVTSSDPVFSSISSLGTTAANTLTQTCTPQTVVTQPAQYANEICVVAVNEEDNSCSQYLSATVTKTQQLANVNESCSQGTLQGNECVSQGDSSPALVCPAGYSVDESLQNAESDPSGGCVATNTTSGTGYCASGSNAASGYCVVEFADADSCDGTYNGMSLESCHVQVTSSGHVHYQTAMGYYYELQSCPAGYTWDGSECTETVTTSVSFSCATGTLEGNTCVTTTTTSPTITYSCPAGEALSGTNCIKTSVTTSWSDTCGVYEQSAGSTLATPTQ